MKGDWRRHTIWTKPRWRWCYRRNAWYNPETAQVARIRNGQVILVFDGDW